MDHPVVTIHINIARKLLMQINLQIGKAETRAAFP